MPIVGTVSTEFDFQATVSESIQAGAALAVLPVPRCGVATGGRFAFGGQAGTTYPVGQPTGRAIATLIVPDLEARVGILRDPCQAGRMLRVTIDPAAKSFLDMIPLPNSPPRIPPDGSGESLYSSNEFNGFSGRGTFLPEPRSDVTTIDGHPAPRPPFGGLQLTPPGNYTVRLSVTIGGIRVGSVSSSFSVVPAN